MSNEEDAFCAGVCAGVGPDDIGPHCRTLRLRDALGEKMTNRKIAAISTTVGAFLAMLGALAIFFNKWEWSAMLWMLCSQANNLAVWVLRREERGMGEETAGFVPPSSRQKQGKENLTC